LLSLIFISHAVEKLVNEPANDLERKLMLAADSPANYPKFYTALMNAEVLVIGSANAGGAGATVIPVGSKILIAN